MMKSIYMLAMTLLFTAVSRGSPAYHLEMMAARVGSMWLMHLMHLMEDKALRDICCLMIHWTFAVAFAVYTALAKPYDDAPLRLITAWYLLVDWAYIAGFLVRVAEG